MDSEADRMGDGFTESSEHFARNCLQPNTPGFGRPIRGSIPDHPARWLAYMIFVGLGGRLLGTVGGVFMGQECRPVFIEI